MTTYLITEPNKIAPVSNYIYFELLDWLDGKLVTPYVKQQVYSSVAWSVDNMLTNTGRTLAFRVWEQVKESGDNSIDTFNDFIAAMRADAFRSHALELGGAEARNYQNTIAQLNEYRVVYHDIAMQHDDRYKTPTLEDILKNERPMRVDVQTIKKLKIIVDFQKTLNESTDEEALLAALIERQADRNTMMHQRRIELIPMMLMVITEAIRMTHIGGEIAFHDLDIDIQRTLIERTVGALERTVTNASARRQIDTLEFSAIMAECTSAVKELKVVLNAPKFNRDTHSISEEDIAALRAAHGK